MQMGYWSAVQECQAGTEVPGQYLGQQRGLLVWNISPAQRARVPPREQPLGHTGPVELVLARERHQLSVGLKVLEADCALRLLPAIRVTTKPPAR